MTQRILGFVVTLGVAGSVWGAEPASELAPMIVADAEVYRYEPANNGAGPMWCSGSTCLVRCGSRVWASGLETLPEFPPLNNCRWTLFERSEAGWSRLQIDGTDRTREPCPLVIFQDGQLFLSANPTRSGPTDYSGPAEPQILRWHGADLTSPPETIAPQWLGTPAFTEHSYRSFAADGAAGELILFQNIGYTHAEWAFRDAAGRWPAQGQLAWPWGAEYDQPQPIRICYANVSLRQREVHVCGVSDIVEPYAAWRDYKREITGREWDFDFRRLFYTWSDDITTGTFAPWVEIASRDATAGHLYPCDLWQAADGRVHVLWTEQALDPRLRDKFFPDASQSQALNYAVLHRGEKLLQRSLILAEEGGAQEVVHAARFHVAPPQRLFVFCYVSGQDGHGQAVSENRILELTSDGAAGPAYRVPLEPPLTSFFTATPRAGSAPSPVLDLLGTRAGRAHAMSYVQLRLW